MRLWVRPKSKDAVKWKHMDPKSAKPNMKSISCNCPGVHDPSNACPDKPFLVNHLFFLRYCVTSISKKNDASKQTTKAEPKAPTHADKDN